MTAYIRPRDLDEALDARAAYRDYMVLAGGTDLMVSQPHKVAPIGIVDLWRLPKLGDIADRGDDIRIGAGATWLEIQRHPAVQKKLGPLVAAAKEIGALQIQARGTLGGNVGNSSPVGDSLPVLLALDATLELASVRGVRRVPYREFCLGYRKTALAADELIVAATIPTPGLRVRQTWKKVGTRRAQSISKVMASAWMSLDGETITEARVALGAVADRPIRIAAVETAVRGLRLGEAAEAARAALRGAILPIDDVRSSADYRRTVAENVVSRFFTAHG